MLDRCLDDRYLIRDRDVKFTTGFDMIFNSAGIEAINAAARHRSIHQILPCRSITLRHWQRHFFSSRSLSCNESYFLQNFSILFLRVRTGFDDNSQSVW
jgi:hypothetical protein